MKLYKELAVRIEAYHKCNDEWLDHNIKIIDDLIQNLMPNESEIETKVLLDYDVSTRNKLVFHFSYHHMNDKWTHHILTVKPDFIFDISLSINGSNRNYIKDDLYEVFEYALLKEIKWDSEKQRYYPQQKTYKHSCDD